jgi:MarR family transcriptional regulator, organic hydroperoxide resistance regulator
MPVTKAIPLEQQLCFALYSATIAVNRVFKPLLDERGITYPQYLVLCTLWEQNERTISAIGERLLLEPSTITPLIKRLEKRGFVQRQRNPKDERQVLVRLTAKGVALQPEMDCLTQILVEHSRMTVAQIRALNEKVKSFQVALAREATA